MLTIKPQSERPSAVELADKLRNAKTLEEFFAISNTFPDEEDADAFFAGMNANREGERIPYPPELKGKTW